MSEPHTDLPRRPPPPSAATRLEVVILGQHLTIKGNQDPKYVHRLVQLVNAKVDEAQEGGVLSSLKLAVVAALNLADELLQARQSDLDARAEVAVRQKELLYELDASVEDAPHLPEPT